MQETLFSFTLFLSMAQVQIKQMDLERYNSPSALSNSTKHICVTTLLLLIFAIFKNSGNLRPAKTSF